MKIKTKNFGEIEIEGNKVINFQEGILGFPDEKRYAILEFKKDDPFKWLQAVDNPKLVFVIIDPCLIFPDYKSVVTAENIGLPDCNIQDADIFTIVTIPENPVDITVNLQGPIIFDFKKHIAKQFVLYNKLYTTKHRIFPAVK